MQKFRIIPKLEIKGPNVVKGMRMEGLRVVGKPEELALKYANSGADEVLLIDSVASLYNRNQIKDIVSEVSVNIRVPLVVGGGLRSVSDISDALRSGADKVSLNTSAHKNAGIITEASEKFGAQSIVASVQAKKRGDVEWETLFLNGREKSNLGVVDWCKRLVDHGAGEILLTSIDRDGTRLGPDKELIENVLSSINVPVLVSGGVNTKEDLLWIAKTGAAGVAIARSLHFLQFEIQELKVFLEANGIAVSMRS